MATQIITKENTTAPVLQVTTLPSSTTHMGMAKIITNDGAINTAALSSQDMDKYKHIGSSLVSTDINSISNYGADLQTQMNKFSSELLTAVRAPKCGEMGELITNLLQELEYIDVSELTEKSTFKQAIRKIPLIGKLVSSVDKMLMKYDTIADNVDVIAKKITATRLSSLRDNNALQIMFESNLAYGKQIEELIIAGKLKLEEETKELELMRANVDNYEPHEIQDKETFVHNLSKRINDMLSLRYVVKQSLAQIRLVQNNNIQIADKAQGIVATTLPVWKNQLSLAVALNNQKDSILAQRKITETTNLIIKKNAELLHQNSVDVAKENERGVIEANTLRESTKELVSALQEVRQIGLEAENVRRENEAELIKIEQELDASIKAQITTN